MKLVTNVTNGKFTDVLSCGADAPVIACFDSSALPGETFVELTCEVYAKPPVIINQFYKQNGQPIASLASEDDQYWTVDSVMMSHHDV